MSAPSGPSAPAPRLAVLLCTYNDAARLPRALDAIYGQSRPPDEIIIVDDGSTDNTSAVLARYANAQPPLKIVVNPKNMGVMAASHVGIAHLTAEFFYWASSNDYVLPGFFAGIMELATRHPQTGAVLGQITFEESATGAQHLQEVRAWRESRQYSPAEFLRDYLNGEHIWFSLGPACVYRRKAVLDVGGFPLELGAFGDSFAVRSMGLNYGVAYLAQPCAKYFTGGKSYSDRLYSNPKALLDVIARTAWLMRSPLHNRAFPADYVARWEKDCRDAVIGQLVFDFEERLYKARCLVTDNTAFPENKNSLLRWGFRLVARATHRLGRRILLRRLKGYQGDLSCYPGAGRQQ